MICSEDGCNRIVMARGMCGTHYKAKKYLFEPRRISEGKSRLERAAYLARALVYEGNECVLWPFSNHSDGYAMWGTKGAPSKMVSRLVCCALYGEPSTTEHEAAHSCGNGHLGCINPNHLRWASPKENSEDRNYHRIHGKNDTFITLR